jgi:uncharacterized YigZ family protein
LEEKSTYLTVSGRSEGMYREKGSKFIGIAVPCSTAGQAKKLLSDIRKEHLQAGHLCYAYRFGLKGDIYRANDDGEPSNSAGAPILGQLQSFEVSNVLIGVVRYYGGTNLGVGGLIGAYRTAAKEALITAKIIEHEVYEWVEVSFEYVDMPFVMNLLKKYRLEMRENIFELSCTLKTNLRLSLANGIKADLKSLESVEVETIGIY